MRSPRRALTRSDDEGLVGIGGPATHVDGSSFSADKRMLMKGTVIHNTALASVGRTVPFDCSGVSRVIEFNPAFTTIVTRPERCNLHQIIGPGRRDMTKLRDLEDQIARAERLERSITDVLTIERLRQFAAECRREAAGLVASERCAA
ncbi:conserved hypothetical protein [Bradyrhizobium sp. ORS 278]|nr:conserved hypothetical protein [Bradyrhizobium sp. ORS 278]